MDNMSRVFTTLDLFFPPRVCPWDPWGCNPEGNEFLRNTRGHLFVQPKRVDGALKWLIDGLKT